LLVRLGRRYAARGDYAKGEQAYRRAIAIGEKLEKPDMRTATAITGLAAIFEKQGEYSKAEPLFLLGVPMFESIAGPDHLGTADPIFDFAENSLLSKTNLTSV